MKRFVVAFALLAFAFPSVVSTQPQGKKTATAKKKQPCVQAFSDCPDEGCGGQFDPNLNRLKNIHSGNGEAKLRSLAWMRKLDDPENFSAGDSREELETLGEGQMITVVAYLLQAKAEPGGESCNCGFQTPAETDNHLVLVSKTTVDKFPMSSGSDAKTILRSREPESQTAEFTPRVRKEHPNFTREAVQPLISKTKQKALLVRVTGQLMFDSEHFIRNSLVRKNNWEIHPIFKLEFCETGSNCKAGSDTGWKSLDDLQ
jgi:hypothetical protein